MMLFRNLNVHPMFIRTYWLVAKEDIALDGASDICKHVIDCLYDGWADRLLDADQTTIQVSDPAGATSWITSTMKSLTPTMSSKLMDFYSIKVGKTRWLEPGQSCTINWRNRRKRYLSRNQIEDAVVETRRGLTVLPLFRIYMSMGKDSANVAEFLPLDGYVHMQYTTGS